MVLALILISALTLMGEIPTRLQALVIHNYEGKEGLDGIRL
jgi:hypothetical protein